MTHVYIFIYLYIHVMILIITHTHTHTCVIIHVCVCVCDRWQERRIRKSYSARFFQRRSTNTDKNKGQVKGICCMKCSRYSQRLVSSRSLQFVRVWPLVYQRDKRNQPSDVRAYRASTPAAAAAEEKRVRVGKFSALNSDSI